MSSRIYIWVIAIFIFSTPVIAMIGEQSLDWMVENADVIALVEVTSIRSKPKGSFLDGSAESTRLKSDDGVSEFEDYRRLLNTIAVSKVITILKGTVSKNDLEIEFGFNGSVYPLCNPKYEQAHQYIVFVKRLHDGQYVTLYWFQGQLHTKDGIVTDWHYAEPKRIDDQTFGVDPNLPLQQAIKAIQEVVKSKQLSAEQNGSSERGGPRR